MRYLLDTNILSELVRHPSSAVSERIAKMAYGDRLTSVIAAAEIRYGVVKRGSRQLATQVDAVLAALEVAPFESPADIVYGRLRAELERVGQLIGPNDLLIAAHAVSLGCTLVTDNVREFSRVSSLAVENWLR